MRSSAGPSRIESFDTSVATPRERILCKHATAVSQTARSALNRVGKNISTPHIMKTLIVTLLALLGLTAAVHSQTLLIQTYNSPTSNWTIGKYDATNGTAINPAVRAGLADCWDLLVDTPYTFFTYNYGGVARFDSTTGATLPGGITGSTFSSPGHLALDGAGYMLVASANNKVAKYSMSDWSLVNASFISGLNSVGGMATDMSGHLFISN